MKRFTPSLVAAAALLGLTLAGTALGQDQNAQGAVAAPQAFNAQQGWGDQGRQDRYREDDQSQYRGDQQNQNRGGDPARDRDGNGWGSDRGNGWGNGNGWGSDRGRFSRMNLEGRWVADDHAANFRGDRGDFWGNRGDFRSDRGDFRGRGPMRDMLLPDFIRIDQRPSMIRIADARNHPLQLIMLGGKFDSRSGDRPDYVLGRWRGSALVVERTMPRGATITQTFTLENRGRTLVVRMRREGFGPRTMEITNTFHRA